MTQDETSVRYASQGAKTCLTASQALALEILLYLPPYHPVIPQKTMMAQFRLEIKLQVFGQIRNFGICGRTNIKHVQRPYHYDVYF